MTSHHEDAQARLRALDAGQSFIVQAPAGSGKTGLLVQRYLLLLALVDEPEEILAITFTRKAAAEMRSRVVEALRAAAHTASPQSEHDRLTWQYAGRALARDREVGWRLLENPNRLRIQTIDGLCGSLARQMPITARMGAALKTTDHARALYREAAQSLLLRDDADEKVSRFMTQLLLHLDNDWDSVLDLLAGMLAKRDQWLRHLSGLTGERDLRAYLERGLQRVVTAGLERVAQRFSVSQQDELLQLARYAASNVMRTKPESSLVAWLDAPVWPEPVLEQQAMWRALADLLLTNDDKWRRKVDSNTGFPSPAGTAQEKKHAKEMKDRCLLLLASFASVPDLLDAVVQIRGLPAAHYDDDQWRLVDALVELLPRACAHLQWVFQKHGVVDFTEVAHAAARALGSDEAPTDLALALDYRIMHILVDEFQDTSFGQFELLKAMTAGWTGGDGRTLFLVGDPMQSIYRFREAQVSLFLWARQHGLGHIALEPINLMVNFRSSLPLVQWFNHAFQRALPEHEDVVYGAVPYSPAVEAKGAVLAGGVTIHALPNEQAGVEAQRIVEVIRNVRQARPQASIAILVLARAHLAAIVPALRTAQIPAQAVEIESLATRSVIQDLLALTRALLHPCDDIAWYAVLRAPWCAIDTTALLALSMQGQPTCVRDTAEQWLQDPACVGDTHARLARTLEIVTAALAQRGRLSLRRWIESTWWKLAGPACVESPSDIADAGAFFDLLDRIEQEDGVCDAAMLMERVDELHATVTVVEHAVQLMTIHKAKGLQFDVVIVPGLARGTQVDGKRLLLWQELPAQNGAGEMILAPVAAASQRRDAIYDYVAKADRRAVDYERGRLLYVAATRACTELHLLGFVRHDPTQDEIKPPREDSLLRKLWPVVADLFAAVPMPSSTPAIEAMDNCAARAPRRLVACPVLPAPDTLAALPQYGPAFSSANIETENIEYLWATPTAMAVGTVVHQLLRQIVLSDFSTWNRVRVEALIPRIGRALSSHGVAKMDLNWAVARVVKAILTVLADPRGQWLLNHRHTDSHCEWALSGVVEQHLQNIIIDRSFIDVEGVRWIIDYKTGFHGGSDVDAFLDNERERYREQLTRYVQLLASYETRPIRVGLYFPLLAGWREIDPAIQSSRDGQ